MNSKNVLFVLNCGRSGSTLLKNMLDQHSEVFAPGEMHLWPYHDIKALKTHLKLTSLGNGLKQALTKLHNDEAKADALVEKFEAENTPIPVIVDYLVSQMQGRVLVDKSPTYCGSAATLRRTAEYRAAPGVKPKYLFLYRHPLDVFKSMKSVGFDKLMRIFNVNTHRMRRSDVPSTSPLFLSYEPTADNPCKTVTQCVQASYSYTNGNAISFLKTISDEEKIFVRYEDLITDPAGEMRRICAFLGLAFEPNMLDPFANKSGKVQIKDEVGDSHYCQYSTLDKSLVEGWRAEREAWEKETYTYDLLSMAKQMGYEMPTAPFTAPATLSQAVYHKRAQRVSSTYIEMSMAYDTRQLPFSEAKLERALSACLRSHPALQCQPQTKGKTIHNLYSANAQSLPFAYIDASGLGPAYADTQRRQTLVAAKVAMAEQGAYKFFVLVLQRQKDLCEVVYLFDHMVADGYAIRRFHHLLWDKYMGQALDLPSLNAKIEYTQGLRAKSLYPEVLADYDMARNAGGCPSQDLQKNAECTTSEVHTMAFEVAYRNSRKARFSNYQALYCLYKSVARLYETNQVCISIRNNRRTAYDTDYLGFVAGDYPVCMNIGSESTMENFRLDAKQQMNNVALKSVAYDELFLADKVVDLPQLCAVRYNYFPVVEKRAQGPFFNAKGHLHRSPDTPTDYMIDFLVRDYKNRMEVAIRYNAAVVSAQQVEYLYDAWAEVLVEELGVSVDVTPHLVYQA